SGFFGQQALDPLLVGLVAGEATQEIGARHAGIAHAQLHDAALTGTALVLNAADASDQGGVLLGHQLDGHEQLGQGFQFGDGLVAAAVVLLQGLADLLELLLDGAEALTGDFRVGTTIGLFLGFAVVLGFLFILLVVRRLLVTLGLDGFGGHNGVVGAGQTIVIRVDIAAEDIGQATAFLGDRSEERRVG